MKPVEDKNQDILKLCQLNLIEEVIELSPAHDQETAMKAIDCKKREAIISLLNDPSPIADEVIERHVQENNKGLGGRP